MDIWLTTDNKKKLAAATLWAFFSIGSKGSFNFICNIPYRIVQAMPFGTPDIEYKLEREIAQWVCQRGSIQDLLDYDYHNNG